MDVPARIWAAVPHLHSPVEMLQVLAVLAPVMPPPVMLPSPGTPLHAASTVQRQKGAPVAGLVAHVWVPTVATPVLVLTPHAGMLLAPVPHRHEKGLVAVLQVLPSTQPANGPQEHRPVMVLQVLPAPQLASLLHLQLGVPPGGVMHCWEPVHPAAPPHLQTGAAGLVVASQVLPLVHPAIAVMPEPHLQTGVAPVVSQVLAPVQPGLVPHTHTP